MALDLKEALEIIKGGAWLPIRCITANLVKGTGGAVIEYPRARFAKNRNPVTAVASAGSGNQGEKVKRPPNHHFHFTINLELPNKQIRKIHPILITHVNNQPVL